MVASEHKVRNRANQLLPYEVFYCGRFYFEEGKNLKAKIMLGWSNSILLIELIINLILSKDHLCLYIKITERKEKSLALRTVTCSADIELSSSSAIVHGVVVGEVSPIKGFLLWIQNDI